MNRDSQEGPYRETAVPLLRAVGAQAPFPPVVSRRTISRNAANGNGNSSGFGTMSGPHPAQPPVVRAEILESRSKAPASSSSAEPRPGETIAQELRELAAGANSKQFTERVYARAREILEDAYESAAELRLEALSRVREQLNNVGRAESDTRLRLDEEADSLRAQSTLESKLALQRAQRDADLLVAKAREQADRIVKQANQAAEALKKSAQREAEGVVAEAQRITEEARQRVQAVEALEAQFERTANEFVKWLGYPVNQKQSRLARLTGNPK